MKCKNGKKEREYLRSLMARDHKYQYHPNRE